MAGKSVLLVEPNERDCRAAHELLRGLGYQVIAIGDVEAAVAVFPYTRAELVLTAHPLPVDESGRDFAGLVKREAPATRVIGLVSRSGTEVVRDALRIGCDELLVKPVTLEALYATILQLIGPAEAEAPIPNQPPPAR